LDLCSGAGNGIVWLTTTRTQVSDATAVTFSVKCFNLLKLCPLSGNIFRKRLGLILFIYSRLFNENVISIVNLIAVMTLSTDVRFTLLLAKNIILCC